MCNKVFSLHCDMGNSNPSIFLGNVCGSLSNNRKRMISIVFSMMQLSMSTCFPWLKPKPLHPWLVATWHLQHTFHISSWWLCHPIHQPGRCHAPPHCPPQPLPNHWRLGCHMILWTHLAMGLCTVHRWHLNAQLHWACPPPLLPSPSCVTWTCPTHLAMPHLWHKNPIHPWTQPLNHVRCCWLQTCPGGHWCPPLLCSHCGPHHAGCPWHSGHPAS